MHGAGASLPPEAVDALERGQVIEAIKIVRVSTGLGLKESKDAVDAYLAANPALKERNSVASSQASRSALLGILLILLVGIAIYLVFRQKP